MNYKSTRIFFILVLFAFAACTATKKIGFPASTVKPTSLRLLGEYDIPHDLKYDQTTVGGLSGIDYDPATDLYYLICDDRSAINPARFYTARIFLTDHGIDSVRFTGVKNLLRANGQVYPNNKQDALHVPDPEAMRYNPVARQLVWSSEGERIITGKDTILANPAITVISTSGNYVDSFPLPVNLQMHAYEKGPRQNGVLEGMSFADQFKTLYISVEEPLYEDGPRADTMENNAYVRFFRFDARSKKNTAQFAYKLDPIPYPAIPATGYKINGIPDILAMGDDQLLVIERAFSTGRIACTIKVFLASLNGATDISGVSSLKSGAAFTPASKKLLLNMDALGIYIDIEGMTMGPVLPNGHKTILFMADNNFSPLEKSQLFLFEVVE